MIITCNNCNSRFNIDEKLIKPQGSKVKCSKCQTIFTVYPPPVEEEPIATPPPLEPELELPAPAPPPPAVKPATPAVAPPPMPPLLDEDEDSGVDIEKDFAPKSSRSTRKPVFEEPDVVGEEAPVAEPPVAPAAQPTRVPRRVPARSAGGATAAQQRAERPVRSTQRRPTPSQAASADMTAKRTMAPPVVPPTAPPLETEEFAHDTDTFTDTPPAPVPAAKPVKGKRGKPAKEKPVKEKKERSSSGGGFKKLLLLILVIIVLLIIAAFALPKAGIEVPFLDKLNLSQLLGGGSDDDVEDEPSIALPNRNVAPEMGQNQNSAARVDTIQDSNGILHFYMDSELVNSGILGNTSSGVIIIVEGLLQNNYDDDRKAIKIVGRLYNERYELEQEKIVYAGNLLTEDELVTLNPTEIENRLFTNGREATAPANGSIPFMIVFSNIPEPVSSYTYECELVSSERATDTTPALP